MRTGTAQLCFCRCVATATIQTILLLLAILVVVAIVARRLNSAPSILLVVAGIALALTRDLPPIELAPELVLLGVLPPLISSPGVATTTSPRPRSTRAGRVVTRSPSHDCAAAMGRPRRSDGRCWFMHPMGKSRADKLVTSLIAQTVDKKYDVREMLVSH